MPVAHMHATHFHKQWTVQHAMPNLLVMAVTEPHFKEPLLSIPWSIETICIHAVFHISLFFGRGGGASSSEASPNSINHSNWYAKL